MQRLFRVVTTSDLFILKTFNYKQNIRHLNLLECDSKKLLQKFGVNVQKFITIDDHDDIANKVHKMNIDAEKYVIKAQIKAGGRGIGIFDNRHQHGICTTDKRDDIEHIIRNMIGHRLITKQTSPSGDLVKQVMVAKFMKVRHESYFCILLDSSHDGPIIITSPNGGTDIEDVHKNNNDTVKIFPVDITKGITEKTMSDITTCLGFNNKLHNKVSQQITSIWNLFIKTDATQIEINPLAETEDQEIVAIDAKIKIDDNALFRQNITFDEDEGDEREMKAVKNNLNYVRLGGNIGCLVNGAGLAMATMDIIKLYGGEPANFLDVGGGTNEIQVFEAMKILISDTNVRSILVNIFGGIVDCTVIANGIIRAMKEIDTTVTVTIRFEGNNVEDAKKVIADFDKDFRFTFAEDIHEAAQLAINNV